MKTIESSVLFIEPSNNRNNLLLEILFNLNFVVLEVNNLETAIHKAVSLSPDLIICQEEFEDYTGFQVYNMLEREILKNGIPFILILNEYNKNSLMMGIELGIDGFIFPPFDAEKISNIIRNRIRKYRAQQAMSFRYFRRLYDLIPLGIFVAENRRIVEANHYLHQILDENSISELSTIDNLFDFDSAPEEKTKLTRFINGLNKSTAFNSIALKINPSEKYKVELFYLENGISGLKVVGIISPDNNNGKLALNDNLSKSKKPAKGQASSYHKNGLFTKREQQVLELSGQGLPIKLIADQLSISERTVEKHRSNILRKTNAGNIIEALFYVKKHDVIEIV